MSFFCDPPPGFSRPNHCGHRGERGGCSRQGGGGCRDSGRCRGPDQCGQSDLPPNTSKTSNPQEVRTLYHATSRHAAQEIQSSGEMKPGTRGMYGAGMYFASTKEDARRKARFDGSGEDMLITADVWVGCMLEVRSPMGHLTGELVRSYGCHSVHGIGGNGDEFVVFRPHRIRLMSCVPVGSA
jgi:hypothetical protein